MNIENILLGEGILFFLFLCVGINNSIVKSKQKDSLPGVILISFLISIGVNLIIYGVLV